MAMITLEELVETHHSYSPTIDVSESAGLRLANAFDAAMAKVGQERRAHRVDYSAYRADRLPQPGAQLRLMVNQGWRDAVVLAQRGTECMVEYTMPKGTTALCVLETTEAVSDLIRTSAGKPAPLTFVRNYSYRAVPSVWVAAMQAAGMSWDGKAQRGRPVPSP